MHDGLLDSHCVWVDSFVPRAEGNGSKSAMSSTITKSEYEMDYLRDDDGDALTLAVCLTV